MKRLALLSLLLAMPVAFGGKTTCWTDDPPEACAPDANCYIQQCEDTTTGELVSFEYRCYSIFLGARVYDDDKSFKWSGGGALVQTGHSFQVPSAQCLDDFPSYLDDVVDYLHGIGDAEVCAGTGGSQSKCQDHAEDVCGPTHIQVVNWDTTYTDCCYVKCTGSAGLAGACWCCSSSSSTGCGQ